ncbi:hypothetical protein [Spiroplasma sp. BIUS-1]|uniref:hypothetical protein n=1 Tax=Spiroplasma sp. BIUS-1 TaxID=216964 RepID=UPI00139801D8|nr:hypothetical protein [Spiroplasma sp. BIUS-1]QHX36279.1 hypothetical protein SBIUS_v1c00260 [Spiroplasma sp. BIUS-1]
MKKLLSVLGTFAIVTPGISAVASCGISTSTVETLIDGNNKFKIGDDEVGLEKVFGTKSRLAILGYQILDALSFTEDKYQNKETLEKQKAVLGDNGQALSLDNVGKKNKTANIEFNDQTTPENGRFTDSYNSAMDSKFTKMDFQLGVDKKIEKDGIWTANNATVFTADKAKTLEAEIKYDKDGKVSRIEKSNTNSNSNLKGYIDTKWEGNLPQGDYEEYKSEGLYTMDPTKAESLYDKLKADTSDQAKKLVDGLSKEMFKLLHTQLNNAKKSLEHGIVMPGKFDNNFNGSGDISLNDYKEKETAKITENKFFFTKEDKKSLQSQVVGGRDNENRTFVYGESDNDKPLEIEFTFTVPKDKKREIEEKNYKINVSLKNLIVGYQLNGAILEKGKEASDKDKSRTDTAIYWYEPVFYQFTDKEMFRTNSSQKANDGTKDVFDKLSGATIKISNA